MALRTPILRDVWRRLADINDVLCYYDLSAYSFGMQLAAANVPPDTLTTALFSNAVEASRLTVPIARLPDFHHQAAKIACGAVATIAWEHIAQFIEDLRSLLSQSDAIPSTEPDTPIERSLESDLVSKHARPERLVIETLAYWRLRRNSYVHLNPNGTETARAHIRNHGHELSEYWASKASFDFRSLPPAPYTSENVITMFRQLRRCAIHLDRLVATTFDTEQLVKALIEEVWNSTPRLRAPEHLPRKVRMVQSLAAFQYGLKVPEEYIEILAAGRPQEPSP